MGRGVDGMRRVLMGAGQRVFRGLGVSGVMDGARAGRDSLRESQLALLFCVARGLSRLGVVLGVLR